MDFSAEQLIAKACASERVQPSELVLNSDNGGPMMAQRCSPHSSDSASPHPSVARDQRVFTKPIHSFLFAPRV